MSFNPTPPPGQNPNQPQARQLNLQQMAGQFMAGVQRHLDLLAFHLTGQAATSEEAFRERVNDPRLRQLVGPLGNFEQLQAFARDVLTRQVIGDATNLAVGCLNNCHLFLALVKASGGAESRSLDPSAQQAAQQSQEAFVRAPLDEKFNLLEEHYGVMCPLEDTIAACGIAIQTLLRNGGLLQKEPLSDAEELTFELQTALPPAMTEGKPWFDAVETQLKTFRPGERIAFSDTELQLIFFTVAIFAHQLFTAVTRYARDAKSEAAE